MDTSPSAIQVASELHVRQVREIAELFGFETRNKYEISSPEMGQIAFAAEQQKGVLGFLLRQTLGHWRPFEIHFMGPDRQPVLRAVHPFRFFFQRLEVYDVAGRLLGALQQRFAFFQKRFDVVGPDGRVLLEMKSGFFRIWTFPFFRGGEQVAVIEKKWSGALTELFTDKDRFRVRFTGTLTAVEKQLIAAAAIFVDLQYFEKKAS